MNAAIGPSVASRMTRRAFMEVSFHESTARIRDPPRFALAGQGPYLRDPPRMRVIICRAFERTALSIWATQARRSGNRRARLAGHDSQGTRRRENRALAPSGDADLDPVLLEVAGLPSSCEEHRSLRRDVVSCAGPKRRCLRCFGHRHVWLVEQGDRVFGVGARVVADGPVEENEAALLLALDHRTLQGEHPVGPHFDRRQS